MRALILALAAVGAALAACATTKPPPPQAALPPPPSVAAPPPPPPAAAAIRPAARVNCVPRNFPRAPRYPDTDKALRAAGGAADRYQLLAAGRLVRARRLAELERALEGCR